MKSYDQERLLESIARLTEKRDRESLELCLMQTMFELLSVEEIALYQVEGANFKLLLRINPEGCWSLNDENVDPEFLEAVSDTALFTGCLQKRRMQVDTANPSIQRYAFPILHKNHGVGVLSLESLGDLANNRRLIAGFLRIYQNYLGLIHESVHDNLTGLLNRKAFEEHILNIFVHNYRADINQERRRTDDPQPHEGPQHYIAVLDVDHFKRVNDTFGHLYGDEVLLMLANLMRSSFRRSDLLFRYGGEEFVIVLKTLNAEVAFNVLDKFRQAVQDYHFPQVGQITVSIGFAEVGVSDIPAAVIERADRALYFAKSNGRNQVQHYEQLISSGSLCTAQAQAGGDVDLF